MAPCLPSLLMGGREGFCPTCPVNASGFSLSHLNGEPAVLFSVKELLPPPEGPNPNKVSSQLCSPEPQGAPGAMREPGASGVWRGHASRAQLRGAVFTSREEGRREGDTARRRSPRIRGGGLKSMSLLVLVAP